MRASTLLLKFMTTNEKLCKVFSTSRFFVVTIFALLEIYLLVFRAQYCFGSDQCLYLNTVRQKSYATELICFNHVVF